MYQESYVRIPRPVLSSKKLKPSTKLVFGALHGYAWGEKEEAWPSVKRLANDTGLSVRAVQYAVKELEEHGLVKVTYRKDPDNPTKNIPNLYVLEYVAKDDVVQKVHHTSRKSCTTPDADSAPKVEEPSIEKRNKPIAYISDSSSDEKEEDFMEILGRDLWRQEREKRERELCEGFEQHLLEAVSQ